VAKVSELSVSDDSLITLPLRNLVAIAFGLIVASTGYVTMNQEITQHSHELLMQQSEIDMNSNFRVTWPKEGLLAADVQQNSRLDSIEAQNKEHTKDLRDLQASINEIKVTLGVIEAQSATAEQKIERLYTLYNEKLTEVK
jgi:septal ring factor EnvC (AmiA/AmiB activator)